MGIGIEVAADTSGVEFAEVVSDFVRPWVPHDGYGIVMFDPVTGIIGEHLESDAGQDAAALLSLELAGNDLHHFRDLAAAPSPVGLLGTGGREERGSFRLHEVLRPSGFDSEARLVLRAGGRMLAALSLLRERRAPAFDDSAVRQLTRIAPVLTAAVRRHAVSQPSGGPAQPSGPGVAVFGGDDAPLTANVAAWEWFDQIDRPREARPVPLAVRGTVFAARCRGGSATSRVKTGTGRWLAIHASELGDGGRVAVTMQPATPQEMLPALLAWHGLTPRESEVIEQLLDGMSTKQIARRLSLSALTVNDHLKAIYRKTGVNGRDELVAHLSLRR